MSKRTALIGKNISHSFSPRIHNFWYKFYNIDAAYELHEISSELGVQPCLQTLLSSDYVGCNITSPYKGCILKYADSDDHVKAIGASNIITFDNGRLVASNVDFIGFEKVLFSRNFNVAGKTAIVFGAGGIARAIIYSLLRLEISKVFVCNRTMANTLELARTFGGIYPVGFIDLNMLHNYDVDIIINTLGSTSEYINTIREFVSRNEKNGLVCDLTYGEFGGSPLRDVANLNGCEYISALEILISQAAASFEKWFGIYPNPSAEELLSYLNVTF